ncbi:MAG: small multi-drug export protein [Spirochaetaceae bacterium]|nr:small multi-drug export protein [Spirochaetaceae bacterium]
MRDVLITVILSMLPISELRGAIPYAMSCGTPWYAAWPLCSAANAAVAPACWIFLCTFHKLFLRFSFYETFFNRFVDKARKKLKNGVEKWGAFGVALFVAVPLPLTGAWTGTLGAWVLGVSKLKTIVAVICGVIVSGGLVTAVMSLGIAALRFFVKG